MIRQLVSPLLLAVVVRVTTVSALPAQLLPPSVSAPKAAAARAASAAGAHAEAMQQDGTGTQPQSRSAAAPAAATMARPSSAAGAPGATPGRAPNFGADDERSTGRRGSREEISLVREAFTYDAGGRRDPFLSLLASGELRPMMSDLKLVTVVYDPTGRSVAVLRDVNTKEQYRVRAGQQLGRMRVAEIQPKAVTFTLEEFGYSRQETLALNDTTKARIK